MIQKPHLEKCNIEMKKIKKMVQEQFKEGNLVINSATGIMIIPLKELETELETLNKNG